MHEEYAYLYPTYVDNLKQLATTIFNIFSDAYENLSKDVNKAEKQFQDILIQCDPFIKSLSFYNASFISLKRDEDYFYTIQILSLAIKASHNSFVIARHNKEEHKKELAINNRSYYKGLFYFYYQLTNIFKVDNKVKEVIEAFYKEVNFEYVDIAIAHLELVNYLGNNGMIDSYFASKANEDYKHWFTAYKRIKKFDNIELHNDIDSCALFLFKNIEREDIKKLIIDSIFFECVLLEYCYLINDKEKAKDVIYLQYDHYLEIDSLNIIYTYDKAFFKEIVGDLKEICKERLISKCDEKGKNHLIVEDVFEEEFFKDLLTLLK